MSNVAHLIRRQSSRDLLRPPLPQFELRELRLLPAGSSDTSVGSVTYGTTNNCFTHETCSNAAQVAK